MRYKLEFLSESTDESSVSSWVFHNGPLTDVVAMAMQQSAALKPDGFQIRDAQDAARIVWLEHLRT